MDRDDAFERKDAISLCMNVSRANPRHGAVLGREGVRLALTQLQHLGLERKAR